MIVASCPLRISLVGGSTDSPRYIDKYGEGSVVSFPCNLRTYATIHQDMFGANAIDHNYSISYSKHEKVDCVSKIQNELVRHCFEYLNVERINCALVSDIYSSGSGLASSSAYLQALIKAIHVWRRKDICDTDVCILAEKIEKKFNPLVGRQDFFGSMGGLKKITFLRTEQVKMEYLSPKIFDDMDMYLWYTGVLRNSTEVLQSIKLEKSKELIHDTFFLRIAIQQCDVEMFNDVIRTGWRKKKETSPMICSNPTLQEMDHELEMDSKVLSHKLCGAGNGGYFLIFTEKDSKLDSDYARMRRIDISQTGLEWVDLRK